MAFRRWTQVRVFERLEYRYLLNVGDLYSVPTNPRVATNLDASWKFALNPSGSPQNVGYDDSSWSTVNLPYTWDGSTTNAPLGLGWYRKTISVDPSLIGKGVIPGVWRRVPGDQFVHRRNTGRLHSEHFRHH